MNLTESQKAQITQARAEGRTRIMSEFTPEQRADWERRVAAEMAAKDETIRSIRKQESAAREPGFSGDLRRAIAASGIGPRGVAEELSVDGDLMERFCSGEAALPYEIIDKLVEYLGLRLMKLIR